MRILRLAFLIVMLFANLNSRADILWEVKGKVKGKIKVKSKFKKLEKPIIIKFLLDNSQGHDSIIYIFIVNTNDYEKNTFKFNTRLKITLTTDNWSYQSNENIRIPKKFRNWTVGDDKSSPAREHNIRLSTCFTLEKEKE